MLEIQCKKYSKTGYQFKIVQCCKIQPTSIQSSYLNVVFMPPYRRCRRHYVSGLSVRPDVCPDFFIYAIFTSLTRNLKNLWVDFHQTWYRGAPQGVDELIRFWAWSAQRQRSMNLVSICCFYLVLNAKSQEPLGGFSSNWVHGCTTRSRWTD